MLYMRTNKSYRIAAFLLAVLMFSTSVGFAVDMHYCGDQLKSFNLFGKAKTCMEKAGNAKNQSCTKLRMQQHAEHGEQSGDQIEKSDCCHDKTVQVQSNQQLEVPSVEMSIHPPLQQFILAYLVVFLIQLDARKNNPAAESYRPPLIPRDILVLIQSFLL